MKSSAHLRMTFFAKGVAARLSLFSSYARKIRPLVALVCVSALLGAASSRNALGDTFADGDFTTYDQLDYADPNGGTNANALLVANYDAVFAPTSGVFAVGTGSGFSMAFDGANAITSYLPANGPVGALDSSLVDPTTSPSGQFGGDVVALDLDIDFSDAGVLPANSDVPFGDLVLTDYFAAPPGEPGLEGLTVRQFSAVANTLLAGGSYGSYTIADIDRNTLELTDAFDDGTVSTFAQDHLALPASVTDVPEPSTWALLLGGLGLLALARKFHRRAAAPH